jgi:hypothetical protein
MKHLPNQVLRRCWNLKCLDWANRQSKPREKEDKRKDSKELLISIKETWLSATTPANATVRPILTWSRISSSFKSKPRYCLIRLTKHSFTATSKKTKLEGQHQQPLENVNGATKSHGSRKLLFLHKTYNSNGKLFRDFRSRIWKPMGISLES